MSSQSIHNRSFSFQKKPNVENLFLVIIKDGAMIIKDIEQTVNSNSKNYRIN